MTKKITILCSVLVFILISCNVQERIVFNEDMGGRYETSFDLSKMMATMNEMGAGASNPDKKKTKMDTIVVFADMFKEHKDSIANLSAEEQAKLEMLKDFTMKMKMDEETGEFKMNIYKDFKDFSGLERVAYEMDNVLDQAKSESQQGQQAGPGDDLMSLDKVIYTFENNTFRRTDPKSLSEHLEDEGILKEETRISLEELKNNLAVDGDDSEENAMIKGMMGQFAEELENSMMKLEYVFPRKVVSVSPEGATISKDGKTVTFEVPWSDLLEEKAKVLENFEVVLEE
ncbi:hypothetical protein GCM10011344_20290 [Dokdonia pacifica]|uniref:Lipoprotein n=1 Tax=Dokdonia pacifica TaxID=1627892 RepID=A0A238VNS0_9FLAO|nr:hypothetical protein [Dokdonia pacifica]GGG19535.1 hypothetical protein GCM10011344_20290 [Dokdonia pacifica]SNR35868.1 hypothetical protein SAMN06265376_101104 [Dokdonia pacifica]